jgi:hypothetical protein
LTGAAGHMTYADLYDVVPLIHLISVLSGLADQVKCYVSDVNVKLGPQGSSQQNMHTQLSIGVLTLTGRVVLD